MFLVFAVLAGVFFVAERLWPARPRAVLRRGFFTDVAYVGVHYALRVTVNGTLAVALTAFGERHLPASMVAVLDGRPLWIQAGVLLLTTDLAFYIMHRLKHRWTWWWRLHETHHSSVDLDWLSAARFHPLEKLLDRTLYLAPLIFLGVSDQAILVWASFDAFFGMFIHSNVRWRLGPLIYVFVGPEMHRWHHSAEPRHQARNFGNNFSIFDWLFGTAHVDPEPPPEFGTADPAYPQGNLLRQFLYAFRPLEGAGAPRAAAPARESAAV
jgi:sterol desaturase/sphingolipid hydroxylase (fatty acid hydroxylase superfamily)